MNDKSEQEICAELIADIDRLAGKINRPLRLMEVCGTHTVAIFRAGLRQILPPSLTLVSGPGCPVCVTPDSYMDKAIAYAKDSDNIIVTFGDMLKVPGSETDLSHAKADGADIRIVYSPLDALTVAAENATKKVIFLAVGFETTAPTAAAAVIAAKQQGLKNLFMLSAHKLVPPALTKLITDEDVKVDGFILPGHVAVVTGTRAFAFVAEQYGISGVVAGFTPPALLRAICRILMQIADNAPAVTNEYQSVVHEEGSRPSQEIMYRVYEKDVASWRGIGDIPASGLKMREEFAAFDIERVMPLKIDAAPRRTACRCGDVLKGVINPPECPLFAKACSPTHAVGPCMVSVEGVCAAWHKYGRETFAMFEQTDRR